MKAKILPSCLLVICLAIISLTACKNKKEPGFISKEAGSQDSGNSYQQQYLRMLEEINPGLKDPSAIVTLIEMTGAEFIPELVNNSGNDPQYLADSSRTAINLGVYTVDLVYLLTYDQDEKADILIDKARLLADRIGVGHLYDHGMYWRYRAAGVPSDTLITYFSRAAEEMEHQYMETGLLRLYTLFATGEFIEKLHITTSLLIEADREDLDHYWTIMMLVFQQEKALDNLILLLEHVRGNEEGERFMAMMKDMKQIFMELNFKDEMAGINTSNITKNQTFKDLVEHLGMVRNYIINPE